MAALKEKGIALLGSASGVDMKTAASTTIFTTPVGKVTRVTHVIVRDASGTLAGGTSYSFTNFAQTVDLSNLITANTGYCIIGGQTTAGGTAPKPVQYTEIAAGTAFQITVTTGATSAATASIDVFGYLT